MKIRLLIKILTKKFANPHGNVNLLDFCQKNYKIRAVMIESSHRAEIGLMQSQKWMNYGRKRLNEQSQKTLTSMTTYWGQKCHYLVITWQI